MHRITFPRQDYGRIFVEKEEDIERVANIIRGMNCTEYKYMPDGFITVLPQGDGEELPRVRTIETEKFDEIDVQELLLRCWADGVHVLCWIGEANPFEHDNR